MPGPFRLSVKLRVGYVISEILEADICHVALVPVSQLLLKVTFTGNIDFLAFCRY